MDRPYDVAVLELEAEGVRQMCQRDDRFVQREAHADANAWSEAERNVGETAIRSRLPSKKRVGSNSSGRSHNLRWRCRTKGGTVTIMAGSMRVLAISSAEIAVRVRMADGG